MKNKKIGILTFHAAHNYGSVLQAYALQRTFSGMGLDCEIINFRTEKQKDQYRPLTKRRGLKYLIKNSYFLLNYKNRKKKYDRFEEFIDKYLEKSPVEYESLSQLEEGELPYTHFISGSDQIWNTVPNDASMAYFLPFVKKGKRIAYAPSFGQAAEAVEESEIAEYLKEYDYISVREEQGKKIVYDLTGKNCPVLIDPTMLAGKEIWNSLISDKPLLESGYIFFYTLFADREMINMVKLLSEKLKLPVVISNISNQYEIFSGFKKMSFAGPLDFLNLIKYAKFVATSSFHGTVFSIILQKPFIALRGMTDKRISTLLSMTNLEDRAINDRLCLEGKDTGDLFNVDFDFAEGKITEKRNEAIEFLQNAVD